MKRISLMLSLVVAIAVQVSAVLTVDNTSPLSDNHRVIYEMNVYDFTTQGTFAAATQRLPQLRQLGIDIIWLMPIYPRGVQDKIGSLGSPYAVKDFKAVNPAHGSLANLQTFVNTAHSLGMKVWLDWVPNHTATDHPWTSSHPDYYYRVNGVIQHPFNYGDVYQLNYASSALLNEMINAMRYWVNTADIDGFRCDYASSSFIGVSAWKQMITAVQTNDRNKKVEFMAEADFTDPNSDSQLNTCGFRYDYEWSFADGIKAVGTDTQVSALRNAASILMSSLSGRFANMSRMAYLTNHDDIGNNFSGNYMTQCGANVPPLTVMYFTFFGMPLLYNGQEIGSTKILNYFNRNTINWSSVNTKIHNTIRALIALRHTLPALSDGTSSERSAIKVLSTNSPSVYAFERRKGNNIVLVVLSLSSSAVDVTVNGVTAGAYTKVLDSQTISSGFPTTAVNLTASPSIHLDAKGYQVFTNQYEANTDTYHLYVLNRTSWSEFDLYAWGDTEFFGAWPGATSASTVTKNGITYRDYAYTVAKGKTDMIMNLIFHNNQGETNPADRRQLVDLKHVGDYYITVTDTGCDVVGDDIEQVESGKWKEERRKVLQDGQIWIIRGNERYSILGNKR